MADVKDVLGRAEKYIQSIVEANGELVPFNNEYLKDFGISSAAMINMLRVAIPMTQKNIVPIIVPVEKRTWLLWRPHFKYIADMDARANYRYTGENFKFLKPSDVEFFVQKFESFPADWNFKDTFLQLKYLILCDLFLYTHSSPSKRRESPWDRATYAEFDAAKYELGDILPLEEVRGMWEFCVKNGLVDEKDGLYRIHTEDATVIEESKAEMARIAEKKKAEDAKQAKKKALEDAAAKAQAEEVAAKAKEETETRMDAGAGMASQETGSALTDLQEQLTRLEEKVAKIVEPEKLAEASLTDMQEKLAKLEKKMSLLGSAAIASEDGIVLDRDAILAAVEQKVVVCINAALADFLDKVLEFTRDEIDGATFKSEYMNMSAQLADKVREQFAAEEMPEEIEKKIEKKQAKRRKFMAGR